jgi:hypothetical protein
MLSRSDTRERPRIEPKVDGADKGTLSAADSLRLHWPEYLWKQERRASTCSMRAHLPTMRLCPIDRT